MKATFAGGCFWCIESAFAHLEGVIQTTSGLTGGDVPNPSYEQVHTEDTGHVEAVEVEYDPEKISYPRLLEIFWMQIDPTDPDGQFADRGKEYATAIFYHSAEQKKQAEDSLIALEMSQKFNKPIVTKILPAKEFYPAEEYHQEYYKKNPLRYKLYRLGSGRDSFIQKNWTKN